MEKKKKEYFCFNDEKKNFRDTAFKYIIKLNVFHNKNWVLFLLIGF